MYHIHEQHVYHDQKNICEYIFTRSGRIMFQKIYSNSRSRKFFKRRSFQQMSMKKYPYKYIIIDKVTANMILQSRMKKIKHKGYYTNR